MSKWFYNNELEGITPTVTTGTVDVYFPVTNLNHPHTTKEFRTTNLTQTILYYDLLDNKTVDSFLVCGNRVTGELRLKSIQIQASGTSNFTVVAYDSGLVSLDAGDLAETFKYVALTPTAAYQYWRIILNNDTGYIGCSNIFLGTELGLTTNAIAYGWDFQRVDRSTVQEGRYGNRFIDRISDQKVVSVTYELLNKTEFQLIEQFTTYCGVSKPFWLVIDENEDIVYNANVFSGYFYFTVRPAFNNTAYGLFSGKLDLIEGI